MKRIVQLAIALILGLSSGAQDFNVDQKRIKGKAKLNTVFPYLVWNIYSLEENPALASYHPLNQMGLCYRRYLNNDMTHGLSLSFDTFFIYYSRKSKYRSYGETTNREAATWSLLWNYNFLREGKLSVEILLGGSIRFGGEEIAGTDLGYKVLTFENPFYFDPGISVGFQAEYHLPLNFLVFASGYFTKILYRYDQGHLANPSIGLPADDGSPRRLTTFRVGIGYGFGRGASN